LVYTSCVDDPELGRGTESLHGEVGSGWVGPRGGLEVLEKINTCWPCREPNHDSSIIQPAV
jgi:hypothetical protein